MPSRRRLRAAFFCVSLCCLAGCASPPHRSDGASSDFAPRLATWLQAGERSTAAPDEGVLAAWWLGFDDPTLSGLVQRTLDHNTNLRAAQASLREARAARAAVEAGSRPQVGGNASASRSRSEGRSSGSDQLGFSASWEPDLWGGQAAGTSAADDDVQAATGDLASVRLGLVAEVGLAFVQWRDAQAREAIARDSLARLERTEQLAGWRVAAGLASALDAQQARLSVAQTRAALPALATEQAQLIHQMALLCGETPAALSARLPAAGPVPQANVALAQLALGLPADLLRRRPDLQAAEAAVRAQWARREQTRLAGLPTVSLSGSVGWQAATLSALTGGTAGVAALVASIHWTVFDGGQRRALVDQQDAAWQRSQASYEGAVLAALKDVEDSLVALRGSQQRVVALEQAALAAEQVLQLTRHRQAAGLVDLRTLLDAERDALSAQTSLQTTRSEQTLNLIRLFKSLGGGWSATEQHASLP